MGVGKLRNEEPAGKDDVTEEMVERTSEIVIYWTWKLFHMAFVSSAAPENRNLL